MKLDFVYGATDNGKLNPLDGQQRLTTLWLLHWYIALRAGELNEATCSIFKKFTYETRISSREFCECLCKPEYFKNFDSNDNVGFITNQAWFYSAWKQDPTIQSMLRMLGGTKIADKNPVYVDEVVNWIINVTNNGPDKASEVIVNGSFPESLEFIIYELTKGELESITDDDGNLVELIWKVGDLESNESALLVISSKALEEGEVVNSVSANSSTNDLNQSNNLDSASIDVILNESGENNPDIPVLQCFLL